MTIRLYALSTVVGTVEEIDAANDGTVANEKVMNGIGATGYRNAASSAQRGDRSAEPAGVAEVRWHLKRGGECEKRDADWHDGTP